jgi:hypothetical protein
MTCLVLQKVSLISVHCAVFTESNMARSLFFVDTSFPFYGNHVRKACYASLTPHHYARFLFFTKILVTNIYVKFVILEDIEWYVKTL